MGRAFSRKVILGAAELRSSWQSCGFSGNLRNHAARPWPLRSLLLCAPSVQFPAPGSFLGLCGPSVPFPAPGGFLGVERSQTFQYLSQRKSRTKPHKMRPIPRNLGQNLTRCAPSPEILDKTSQDAPHPRKSWTKHHKMRPISGNLGQDKTSQDAPHPRKSWTKPHKMRTMPGNPGQNLQ